VAAKPEEPKAHQVTHQVQPEPEQKVPDVSKVKVEHPESQLVQQMPQQQQLPPQQLPPQPATTESAKTKAEVAVPLKKDPEHKAEVKVVKEGPKMYPASVAPASAAATAEETKASSVSRETPEPSNPLEAAKNALKKIPHAPTMRRKSVDESENPIEVCIKSRTPVADDGIATPTNEPASPLQSDSRCWR
jgi:hypothetical protein